MYSTHLLGMLQQSNRSLVRQVTFVGRVFLRQSIVRVISALLNHVPTDSSVPSESFENSSARVVSSVASSFSVYFLLYLPLFPFAEAARSLWVPGLVQRDIIARPKYLLFRVSLGIIVLVLGTCIPFHAFRDLTARPRARADAHCVKSDFNVLASIEQLPR